MNKRTCIAVVVAGMTGAFAAPVAERTTEVTTSTVITKTVIKETTETKTKWRPLRVCVLDFSSLDTQGQKRFLDQQNRPINIPQQCTLNDADRKSVNSVMQGFVRMIDAWDNSKTNDANRGAQADDNAFNRAKALELYNTVVKGDARPMVIGAEYLHAYLGKHNDVFVCLDSSLMTSAMNRLQQAPDFPRDFMLRLAKETGATHLIYGVVSDLRTKTNSFKGYGIQTKTTNYQLDVIVKLVDLVSQHTVYSNVYTGNYREQRPISGTQFDNNIFQNLMTAALEQAAEDLYDVCRPGRRNKVTVTPMPFAVTVTPSGGMFFKAAAAEVYVDGVRAGNGGDQFLVPEGKHTIEVKAPGYKTKKFEVRISKDQVINTTLEK